MATTATSAKRAQAQPETPSSKPRKRSGTMIRVPDALHATLRELADETGSTMQDVLAEAVEAMRRQRMFELSNAAYAALRADPVAWQEELEERRLWDVTLADGLEDE